MSEQERETFEQEQDDQDETVRDLDVPEDQRDGVSGGAIDKSSPILF